MEHSVRFSFRRIEAEDVVGRFTVMKNSFQEEGRGMPEHIVKWTEAYQAEAHRNPWYFVIQNEDIRAGERLTVIMYPDLSERVRLGTLAEPVDDGEIQVPRVIVHEVLTKTNARELRSVLTVLEKTQALPFEDGLLMIVHLFFWLVDWDRNRDGEPSLLSERTFRHLPAGLREKDQELMQELLAHPLTTVDKLILLWRHTQDSLVTGLMKPKEPKPGRFTYMFFPPPWLSPEDLRRLNGEGSAVPKIPVPVDADVVRLLEQI
ncbi:MAG: hypothetical protein KBC96_13865, partial [Armatimonadetes bacterium]|nr:hypothetical protein [Armatimonadota bacterium]